MTTNDYLTTSQILDRLGISLVTLRKWERTQGFPVYRLGHRTKRYIWTEVQVWVDRRKVIAPPTATDETMKKLGWDGVRRLNPARVST